MYKIISTLSVIIRQFYLPNPFEPLEAALLYNLIAEPIMHLTTYCVTGIFYENRKAPEIGSLLYLLFYFIHTGLLMLIGISGWSKSAIIIIVTIYLFLILTIKELIDRRR